MVDPQRDISQYVADAAEHGLTIERVIETHFHARVRNLLDQSPMGRMRRRDFRRLG